HTAARRRAPRPDFADNLPKHLAVIGRHMIAYAGQRIGELGVGAGQYPYLFALYSTDHQSQQNLSDELLVDKSSTTAAIDKLEAQGLVVRSADPADRRRRIVSLTKAGRSLRPDLQALLAETTEVLLTGLTPSERDTLHELLRRIAQNITESDGAA
ncbi:MAG: MarR family winged helix-turn-helix transcriptional regulator, partial [Dermatophilaceae bacterium]